MKAVVTKKIEIEMSMEEASYISDCVDCIFHRESNHEKWLGDMFDEDNTKIMVAFFAAIKIGIDG